MGKCLRARQPHVGTKKQNQLGHKAKDQLCSSRSDYPRMRSPLRCKAFGRLALCTQSLRTIQGRPIGYSPENDLRTSRRSVFSRCVRAYPTPFMRFGRLVSINALRPAHRHSSNISNKNGAQRTSFASICFCMRSGVCPVADIPLYATCASVTILTARIKAKIQCRGQIIPSLSRTSRRQHCHSSPCVASVDGMAP